MLQIQYVIHNILNTNLQSVEVSLQHNLRLRKKPQGEQLSEKSGEEGITSASLTSTLVLSIPLSVPVPSQRQTF